MTDNPKFSDMDAHTAWNKCAPDWDIFVESGLDLYRTHLHGPALLNACGSVDRAYVLDLGTGQGYFARRLATNGAQVIGVDLAEEQIALAIAHEEREKQGIQYVVMSATTIHEHWPPQSFNLITACMSLQDMGDIPKVLRNIFELLTVGGRIVFSVPHPYTDTPPRREWEFNEEGTNTNPLSGVYYILAA